MSKTTVIVIIAIGLTLVLIANGEDPVAAIIAVVIGGGVCFAALLVAAIPIGIISAISDRRKLATAMIEFQDIQLRYGYSARDHCPHRVFIVGHTDYVVVTGSDKWCKVCGKHLGVARLKKSWFWGNQWE